MAVMESVAWALMFAYWGVFIVHMFPSMSVLCLRWCVAIALALAGIRLATGEPKAAASWGVCATICLVFSIYHARRQRNESDGVS